MIISELRTYGSLAAIGLFCAGCTLDVTGQSDDEAGGNEERIGSVQQRLWKTYGGLTVDPSHVVGIGNSSNDGYTYTWLDDGKVCKGLYHDMCQTRYDYEAPNDNYEAIVEMAIAENTSQVYTYYSDKTYSRGTSSNLTHYQGKTALSTGSYTMSQLLGVDHSRNGKMYYYWKVGGVVQRSRGTSYNAVYHDSGNVVDVSSGDGDIWGISFDDWGTGDPHEIWAWYESGWINISGNSLDLDN